MSESRDDRTYRVDVHIHGITDVVGPLMGLLEKIIQGQNELKQEIQTMSGTQNQLDAEIAALTAQVTANTTAEGSALVLLNGIPAMIAAAVAAAQAAGATPDELAAITNLQTTLAASAAPLAAAVTSNTPPAGP